MKWSGVIAMESVETNDGRIAAIDSLHWPNLPVRLVEYPDPKHGQMDFTGMAEIGTVETVERDGKYIRATGTLDREPVHTGLEMGVHNMTHHMEHGTLVVDAADLWYVAVGARPVWPECVIEVTE